MAGCDSLADRYNLHRKEAAKLTPYVVIPSRIDITYISYPFPCRKHNVVIPSRIDITYIIDCLDITATNVVIPSRIDITYIATYP